MIVAYTIYSPMEFPFQWFHGLDVQRRGRGNPRTRQKIDYWNCVSAFDIETTRLPEIEQSIMYVWQWAFSPEVVVMGRTWEEFLWFIEQLQAQLKDGSRLVVYVHNLSFEFAFLRGVLRFTTADVFAVKPRKILRAVYDRLEFRCSYLHSNMNLDEFTRKMAVEHQKLSGAEFDYSIERYPWTELSDREREYCVNDVVGLVEALTVEMQHDGDNLYTIPLTSTGYVRRDVKKAMREVSYSYLHSQLPTLSMFEEEREAFRGGDTHANRFYVVDEEGGGQTAYNVEHADRSSSYPDTVCNCLFPVSAFFQVKGRMSWEDVSKFIFLRKKAVLCRAAFSGLELRDPFYPAPYLSRDKCREIMGATYDNGRILEADYLETTITDVDLRIICREYKWTDVVFFDVAYARYGPLPEPLIRTTCEYYRLKTELKGNVSQKIFYDKIKAKINSIYGCMAQNPCKKKLLYFQDGKLDRFGQFVLYDDDDELTDQEILDKSNRRAFLCYQWGLWVTAWARYRLREAIWTILDQGAEFLYCDTDSVFYIGQVDWTEYNTARIKDSRRTGAHAVDAAGLEHYMGVMEMEDHVDKFRTMGAKKYVTEISGNLEVTIAGVGKSAGSRELAVAGGIEMFRPGFTFREAGGVEAIYNDTPQLTGYLVDGHVLGITANVSLRPSSYTLGLSADFERLLHHLRYTIDTD